MTWEHNIIMFNEHVYIVEDNKCLSVLFVYCINNYVLVIIIKMKSTRCFNIIELRNIKHQRDET